MLTFARHLVNHRPGPPQPVGAVAYNHRRTTLPAWRWRCLRAWTRSPGIGSARLLLLGEDGGGDPADAVGVADTVDLDDLATRDGEGQHGERPPVPGDDRSRDA